MPVSNEELCILAQQGDLEARNALILNNQNYICKEANALKAKLELPLWIVEDMIQECTFGFIEAIERFDASRGTKFLTYADFWIKKSCQKIIDEFMPSRELVSLYQALGYDDDTILMDLILDENALDPEECGIRSATIQQIRKALEGIPDRDRMYLHCRFGFDLDRNRTIAETAKRLHQAESRCREIEEEALEKVRRELGI